MDPGYDNTVPPVLLMVPNRYHIHKWANINKIVRLYSTHLDEFLHHPTSILVMLLVFILLLLIFVLFCLVANPILEKEEKVESKTTFLAPKLTMESLQIDYARLLVSHDLENLSQIDLKLLLPRPVNNDLKNVPAQKSISKK